MTQSKIHTLSTALPMCRLPQLISWLLTILLTLQDRTVGLAMPIDTKVSVQAGKQQIVCLSIYRQH